MTHADRVREADTRPRCDHGVVFPGLYCADCLRAQLAEAEAKRVEFERALRQARRWMRHHDWCAVCHDYMNDSPDPADHPACTCGAEVAFDAVFSVIPDEHDALETTAILAWRDRQKHRDEAEARLARLRPVIEAVGAWCGKQGVSDENLRTIYVVSLSYKDRDWALGAEQEGRSDG